MKPRRARGALWGVVLAGGEGTRLARYVEGRFGVRVPKQYCVFSGTRSMLQHTLARADFLIPRERVLTVIDAGHAGIANRQLADRPVGTVLRQPRNLGTAPGMLLPLVEILARDPDANVVFLPSDHFVGDERRFMFYVAAAERLLERIDRKIVLLGMLPDEPESEYGYLQTGAELGTLAGASAWTVRRFCEKPNADRAAEYCRAGYLWNTFVVVAKAAELYRLIVSRLPKIGERFERIREHWTGEFRDFALAGEYLSMPSANVSEAVFETSPERIAVMPVWGVRWSDWGSPDRLEDALRNLGPASAPLPAFTAAKASA